MGKTLDVAYKPQPLAGHLSHLTDETFPAYISEIYDIADRLEVGALMEQLDGVLMHDRHQTPTQFADAIAHRAAVHSTAKEIVTRAQAVNNSFDDLQAAIERFKVALDAECWSMIMLHEVFDMPPVEANALHPPEVFDPVRGFFIKHADTLVDLRNDLRRVSDLPIRPKLRPNKIRNHALDRALSYCRLFWVGYLGRHWTRSSLTLLGPAGSTEIGELQGHCERFVVDMLTAAEIPFELKSLNNAWSAFEKRLRPQRRREQAPGLTSHQSK